MARCEDYPCCGHGDGGCPNEDGSFNCAHCGARLPKRARSSLCNACISQMHRIMDEDPTGQDLDAWSNGD